MLNESMLPGFDNIEDDDILEKFEDVEEKEDILPGFDSIEENNILEKFEDIEEKEDILPGFDNIEEDNILEKFEDMKEKNDILSQVKVSDNVYNKDYLSSISELLLKDKKVVSFVGTTKNGTSFLVNNLAKTLASMGIKTAILDLTSNRNSYYIYTKNQENLRNIAYESIRKLKDGITEGITINQYLDVFTALPGDDIPLQNATEIISTLIKKYSVVLMDCDFDTPTEYFRIAQELYIVQSMDILTIQPMTAFLRDLKAKEILYPERIRVIINKLMNLRGLTTRSIIGGLAFYNDPSMSFMTELFEKDAVKYLTIPFDNEVCIKYLEGIVDCEIKINSYPKRFTQKLKELANMVYPLLENKKNKAKDYSTYNTFSEDMNHTLEQMKKKY